jgi:septal ring factor EnvC (AmiA/AmiB activator)
MKGAAMRSKLRIAVLACGGLVFADTALAEPPKGGGDAAVVQTLRKAQGMLRQLGQEKAELEAKNAELEAQIKTLKALEAKAAQVEPLQNQLNQAKASLEALQGSHASLQQQLGTQTSRLQTAGEQQRKTSGELARTRRDNQLLVNAVKERSHWIEDCAGKNQALVRANREILEKLGSRDFWDSFKEGEPLTGLGAVGKENAVQEFHYTLDDLEVTPWKESAAPSAAADAGPAGENPGGDGEER